MWAIDSRRGHCPRDLGSWCYLITLGLETGDHRKLVGHRGSSQESRYIKCCRGSRYSGRHCDRIGNCRAQKIGNARQLCATAMSVNDRSLIAWTGQSWKLSLASTFATVVSLTLLSGLVMFRHDEDWGLLLIFGGVAAFVIVACWIWSSLTCPRCGVSWFAYAAKHFSAERWYAQLLELATCPQCGFQPPRSS